MIVQSWILALKIALNSDLDVGVSKLMLHAPEKNFESRISMLLSLSTCLLLLGAVQDFVLLLVHT